jgi:hypothetical protein
VLQGVSKDWAVWEALMTLLRDPNIPAHCAARIRDSLSNELAKLEKEWGPLTVRGEGKREQLRRWLH